MFKHTEKRRVLATIATMVSAPILLLAAVGPAGAIPAAPAAPQPTVTA